MGAPDPNCTKCSGSGQYRDGTLWKTCPCTKKK